MPAFLKYHQELFNWLYFLKFALLKWHFSFYEGVNPPLSFTNNKQLHANKGFNKLKSQNKPRSGLTSLVPKLGDTPHVVGYKKSHKIIVLVFL